MFIKKDTRKIPEILTDESDTREYLKLSKRHSLSRMYVVWLHVISPVVYCRPAEFQGSTKLLFQERNLQALLNLKCLNLYDNDLTSVQVLLCIVLCCIILSSYYR